MTNPLPFPDYAGLDVIIGWVAPVGTNIDEYIKEVSKSSLMGFKSDVIRVVEFTRGTTFVTSSKPNNFDSKSYYDKTRFRQEAGNALRKASGCAVLAAHAVNAIAKYRLDHPNERRALHIRSLKHPDEALLLRSIYGSAFFLIGVHGPYDTRFNYLKNRCKSDDKARELMAHDEYEDDAFGQRTREVFELCDGYVEFGGEGKAELSRLFNIYFGALDEAPRIDEYGMAMAYQAAYSSRDLSRQVGAAILNGKAELIATGRNDVPKAGGGPYQKTDKFDVSDYALGYEMGQRYRDDLISQVSEQIETEAFKRFGAAEIDQIRQNRIASNAKRGRNQSGQQLEARVERIANRLRQNLRLWIEKNVRRTPMRDLVEFGRSVHAEMDALTTCARNGRSVVGSTIYTTTFPCHTCARHIVASGLIACVYVEPYPKSKALELHADSISCDAMERIVLYNADGEVVNTCEEKEKVQLRPLIGVAPRRYAEFFGLRTPEGRKVERKRSGRAVHQIVDDEGAIGPRSKLIIHGLLDRETAAIQLIAG